MSVLGEDVQRLFEQIFRAKRAVAAHAEDVRAAEMTLELRRGELEQAHAHLADLEQRMQHMADRAAGVARRISDDEVPAQRIYDGFRPVVRR